MFSDSDSDNKLITTWQDLLDALQKLSPEQRKKTAQFVQYSPREDSVLECLPCCTLSTVDKLQLLYVRSVDDNKRNGDDVILLLDSNPFAEDGAVSYTLNLAPADSDDPFDMTPNYGPAGKQPAADWTGPAQKLADAYVMQNIPGFGTDDNYDGASLAEDMTTKAVLSILQRRTEQLPDEDKGDDKIDNVD